MSGPAEGVDGVDLERLAADLDRVAERLRGLSAARLAAPVPGWSSRAAAARALAQGCADAAARLEAGTVRALPALDDLAVGDQVAVCGHDLVRAAVAAVAEGRPAVLGVLVEQLDDLRRVL